MTDRTSAPRSAPDVGLRAIVAYKTAKAAIQLVLGLLLAVLWPFGLARHVAAWADAFHQHAGNGVALRIADTLVRQATPRTLALALVALSCDGILTAVEAWALRRGRAWGAWLVVATTTALVPFEVYEVMLEPRWTRAVVLGVNLAIVAYLARRVMRERRTRGTR